MWVTRALQLWGPGDLLLGLLGPGAGARELLFRGCFYQVGGTRGSNGGLHSFMFQRNAV